MPKAATCPSRTINHFLRIGNLLILEHWGQETYHGENGPELMLEVTENDTLESIQEENQAMEGAADATMLENSDDEDDDNLDDQPHTPSQPPPSHLHMQSQAQQAQQTMGHEALLPLIQATASMASNEAILHIDPAMQSQPRPSQTAS